MNPEHNPTMKTTPPALRHLLAGASSLSLLLTAPVAWADGSDDFNVYWS